MSWRTPAVILACGRLILMLALGTRQSFGLFLRYGAGRVLAAGGIAYGAGLLAMAHSSDPLGFNLAAGLLVLIDERPLVRAT